jgi:hypothetical protein
VHAWCGVSVGVGDGDENEAGRVGPYRIEYQWILAMSAGGGGESLYRAGLGYPQASLSGQDRAGQGRGRARRGETGQDKTGESTMYGAISARHVTWRVRADVTAETAETRPDANASARRPWTVLP